MPLEVTVAAVADEIAAAADLVKGKTAGMPVAVMRGLADLVTDGGRARRPAAGPAGRRGHVPFGSADVLAGPAHRP